jgi:general secretion pathway protein I
MTGLPRRRTTTSGFTLLEVMIALAILAITLTVLLTMVTNNLRATHHARLTTAATFLARTKMSDVEDSILENGFSTSDETAEGTFKEQGYPEFRWDSAIERVELPMDAMQKQKDEAADKAKDSSNPMSLLTGFIGGMMSSFIEPIRLGLQESVRRVTVHVVWSEAGRPDQVIEIVQYLTDPSKLEAAVTGGVPTAAPGAGGAAPGAAAGAANPLAPSISPSGAKR